MEKIVGYLRVSTDQQAESKLGLEAQKKAIQDYSKRTGNEVFCFFSDEGISGSLSLEKRPGLMSAISALKKGSILVVSGRDRLSRGDVLSMAMIESMVSKKGAKIISAQGEGTENDDISGVLMRRMVDAFAEYERLLIGARTKSALKAKKDRGQRTGHIPFGKRLADDGIHLEQDEKEQDILKQMRDLQKEGLSIRKIAKELNHREAFNRGEATWNNASVHRILKAA